MKKLRKYLLLPFSLLYAFITEMRNFFYDKQILSSQKFDIPIINVGNLSMGGTGKTPQVEYLIQLFKKNYKIAVLSRGYKRKTKGLIIADANSSPEEIGDEAYQIYQKFPEATVVVNEKRAPAIDYLLKNNKPDVILLDDAFQHRQVQAGLNIVLTPYKEIFPDDFILPSGNLRECKRQAKRADIIIVSKSPEKIDKKKIEKKIRKYFDKEIFFSKISYGNEVFSKKEKIPVDELKNYKMLLVTGIAKPDEMYDFLSKKSINFDRLKFDDHHHYTDEDFQKIKTRFNKLKGNRKIILTTEKDFSKLDKIDWPVFYLPIKTEIENEELFNKKILEYVDSKKFI